ncbi:hypothetical protein BJV78DRAFT_1178286 [Lactifluus subvellereus]|nr:hypothetical protein BJV78DRAFT_1178286 [Lactifluus subvellereus]
MTSAIPTVLGLCQPPAIPRPTGKPHNSDFPDLLGTSVSTSPQTKEVSVEARQQPSYAALRRPASCSALPHSVGFSPPLEDTRGGAGRPICTALIQFSTTRAFVSYKDNLLSRCSVSYPSARNDEAAMCKSITIEIHAFVPESESIYSGI